VGIVLGLTAAFCFSLTSILVRVGQRTRPHDDGVFMSVLVNVVVLGIYATLVPWPTWDTPAMIAFIIGGVIGTVGGRTSLLRAVRLVGPSRSNAFLTGTPAVAALAGWLALGETLTPIEMLGGTIVALGLLWLIRARSGGAGGATKAPLFHYVIAAGAPISFGLAFVFRKWGLERFDSSVVGAFVGAASAYLVIVLIDAVRGVLGERARSNFRDPSWWFVGAGFSTSAALLSQFTAFTYLEAWMVGILQATQGIWIIILSILFLKGDEHIDRALIGAVALVVAGVVLIALQ
jgi:drug/metabolite transporter (DMT)-like permease